MKRKEYNSGSRPSQYHIGTKIFLKDNQGSIMHNLIQLEPIIEKKETRLPKNVFSIANPSSNDFFLRTCRERSIEPNPARMPIELANFLIEFLTEPGDLILDPFAGSNTTGFCSERLSRKWISVEINEAFEQIALLEMFSRPPKPFS